MARPDPPPTYHIPETHLERREQLREASRRERAQVLYELVLLVPAADQGEALRLVLALERVTTEAEGQLRQSWAGTVCDAYGRGRMEQATEDLRAISGLPACPDDHEAMTRH